MRFLVMRKESIATSVTASATLCTVHMYLISESLNKVNLSVLRADIGSGFTLVDILVLFYLTK